MAGPVSAVAREEVRDRLESARENVAILLKQTRDGQTVHSVVLGTDVISRLNQTAQLVSDACTELVVLFSNSNPSPDNCCIVCRKVEESSLLLVAALLNMTPRDGTTLLGECQSHVFNVLGDLEKLIATVMKDGCTSASHLQRTGSVWQSCKTVSKMSKDNRSAALKVFLSQLHLLKDACTEVVELKTNNGIADFEMEELLDDVTDLSEALGGVGLEGEAVGGWTSEERNIVSPCISLIQLSTEMAECSCRLVVSHGDVTNEQCVSELDEGCVLVHLLSPAVDELASELSSPVDVRVCQSMGSKLGNTLLQFIDTISNHHYCLSAPQEKWPKSKYVTVIKDTLRHFK